MSNTIKSEESIDISEEDSEDLTSKVFAIIVDRGKAGILQSELWKVLNLTSRDGSRIAIRLEKRALVSRERVLENGRWTYRLVALKLPADTKVIEEVPCLLCNYEYICNQDSIVTSRTCKDIEGWAIKEYRARN